MTPLDGHVRFHASLTPLLEPVERLTPHPDNPNNGDVDAIAESIEVSGMYRPVMAQRSTGYIVAGNTTYAACLSLGANRIPIVWLDIDDDAALRILLGDNQLARLAIVDTGLLQPLLDALLATDLALLGTGYTTPPPLPEPAPLEPSHLISILLTGEDLVHWFELPGDTDRERLDALLSR